jgi:sugar/nucleoside kinase (ribokinase family)
MKASPHGLFVGLTTVDFVFGFDTFPLEDTKNTARDYAVAAGGPASNAAVAFASLGGATDLVSSLGTSPVANIARADLDRYGVTHHDLTPTREVDPALSAIAVAATSGSRTVLTSPAISEEVTNPNLADLTEVVERADIVLVDGHQSTTAREIAARAHARGKPVVLDGDLYKPGLEAVLPNVDIAIFGKSFSVDGSYDTEELAAYFIRNGVAIVVATAGADPIAIISEHGRREVMIQPTVVVDTLAAGDFFHGAFCYAWAAGEGLSEAIALASATAALSIARFGPRAWIADATEAQ